MINGRMEGEVGEWNGQTVVMAEWQTDWNRPVQLRQYWPITAWSGYFELGEHVTYWRDGLWTTRMGYLQMPNGAGTVAVHVEERPLAQPTRSKRWHYECGEWTMKAKLCMDGGPIFARGWKLVPLEA